MLHFVTTALLILMLGLMLLASFMRVMIIPRRYGKSIDDVGEQAERRELEIDRHKQLRRPE